VKSILVKEMMVPIADCATVNEYATLYEVVLALEGAPQKKENNNKYIDVLVLDKAENIVGKVSPLDLIKGLEEGYNKMGELKYVSHSGYTVEFIRSMMEKYKLWEKPLDHICMKAAQREVKAIMSTPSEDEYIEANLSLDAAIHQILMGRYQSLVVTEAGKIQGLLRARDVHRHICSIIKACRL